MLGLLGEGVYRFQLADVMHLGFCTGRAGGINEFLRGIS